MHIWQYSLTDFTGVIVTNAPDPVWEGEFDGQAQAALDAGDAAVEAFGPNREWQLHSVAGRDLIVTMSEGTPIAAMIGGVVAVAPRYRKQGIASELLLRAWADQAWSPSRVQTTATGQRLLRTAYRRAIFRAAEAGAPVSPLNLRAAQLQVSDLVHLGRPIRTVVSIFALVSIVTASVGAAGVWFLGVPDILNAIFAGMFVLIAVSTGHSAMRIQASAPVRFLLTAVLASPGVAYFAATFATSFVKYASSL